MKKYRIIQYSDVFFVQKRFLFFIWLTESYGRYYLKRTLLMAYPNTDLARARIRHLQTPEVKPTTKVVEYL